MGKLELKHLAPYLPYEINIYTKRKDKEKILKLSIGILDVKETFEQFKPILRPLSDLTKEIKFDGNKFIPYKDLEIELDIILLILDGTMSINNLAYSDVEYLIKWHFDVFGLIEKGLAIDFNTLKDD